MEASELRIGNYITVAHASNAPIERVAGISKNLVVEFERGTDEWGEATSLGLILPIPLTEEWLVKFGFSHIQKDYEEVSQSYQIDYWFKDAAYTHVFVDARAVFLCHDVVLNHVHQLQNLYYALTGQELEVK